MQMIVPGCEDCVGWNLAILDAESIGDADFAYCLETDLSTHNEAHSEEDNTRRVSWSKGLKLAGVR